MSSIVQPDLAPRGAATASSRAPSVITAQELRAIPLLQRLSDPERRMVASACRSCRVEKGSTIIHHGEQSTDVYLVLAGTLRVNMYSATARYITFELLDTGSMVGEFAAIDGAPR